MLRHLCDEDTDVFPEKNFQPAVRKLATDLLLSGKAAGQTVPPRLQQHCGRPQRRLAAFSHEPLSIAVKHLVCCRRT